MAKASYHAHIITTSNRKENKQKREKTLKLKEIQKSIFGKLQNERKKSKKYYVWYMNIF